MNETNPIDTMKVEDELKSSATILAAIKKAEDYFNPWQHLCDTIDDAYSRLDAEEVVWADPDYDLFWSSVEILKQSIYARPPKPVVSPMFSDRRKLYVTTADLLERSVASAYEMGGIDEALLCARDDLIFYNRGQIWVTYEDDDGQRVCIDHLDRSDFVHPPARKWSEVPWAAKRAWLSEEQMDERFGNDIADKAHYITGDGDRSRENQGRCPVYEVWHKSDNMVYWVSPGIDEILDSDKPHYELSGFFPCPRPAYGTLRPRTLMPRPDYIRYVGHFTKINSLTRRIYALLDMVRMKGLVAAGGDIGDAIEQLMREDRDASILIPVPGALISGSGAANFVQWLPLAELAQAIQGLIEARRELFSDYDRLSGISDIMRGETEATETLGAQRLKGQYGSVRVRAKCDEIVRLSRDVTRIAAEIMAEHFSAETLLDMAQMEIPTEREIKAQVKEIEDGAEAAMNDLTEKAKQAAQQTSPDGQTADPAQIQKELQQAQQQIVEQFAPQLKMASDQTPIEAVMKLLRDKRARNFAFEIETDSTILTDENEAKASAAEFYQAFTGGMQGLMGAAQMGEEAIRVAAEVLKYTLSPYRPPRSVMSAIDDFLDAAPQIAERSAASQAEGGEDQQAMAQLAQAELMKAQAQGMNYQAQAELKAAELQAKTQEGTMKLQQDQQRFALEVETAKGDLAKTKAEIEKIRAEIEKMGVDVQFQAQKEQREDVKTAADIQTRQQDQAMKAQGMQQDAQFRAQDGQRADRQLTAAERAAQMKGQGNGKA